MVLGQANFGLLLPLWMAHFVLKKVGSLLFVVSVWPEISKSNKPSRLRHAAKGSWTSKLARPEAAISFVQAGHTVRLRLCTLVKTRPRLSPPLSSRLTLLSSVMFSSPSLYDAPAQPGFGEVNSQHCWGTVSCSWPCASQAVRYSMLQCCDVHLDFLICRCGSLVKVKNLVVRITALPHPVLL